MTRRAMLHFLFLLCLVAVPAVSQAAPAEFRVLFDDDNSIATGCTVAGMPGVDQILITRLDLGATSATVTGTSRQLCVGNALGALIPVATTGWPAAYSSASGALMIETRVPFSAFDHPGPGLPKMRIGVDARQGALVHTALLSDTEPVYFPVPTKGKRRSVAAPGAVRVILLDGVDTDWAGLKNKFVNIGSGGVPGWRMSQVLAYANTNDDFLYFAFYANVSDDAPFAADDQYSREQGEGLTVPGVNGVPTVLANDIDPNGDALSATLVTPPSDGDVILDSTGGFTYTPDNPNAATSDSFEYRASDGTHDSNVATVTILVDNDNNSPNKAPSFTKGPNVSVDEDAPTQFINNWATNITAGAGEDGQQAVSFVITNNTDPSLFEHQPQVSPSGQLSFTPAADAFGSATISIKIVDDGGTANGGTNESAVQTFVITVGAINDEPTFTAGGDVVVAEDSGSFSAQWATNISAGPNESQTVSFLVSNDNNGLFSAQPAVSSTGVLTFTPAANAHGVANVQVTIVDNGSNTPPNDNTGATASFTITVNSLNDPPSFNAGPNQTVNEDAGPQTVNPWANAISPGPADESGQSVNFNITGNSNLGLFSAGPTIDSAGVLTYTPAANAHGSANITITLSDTGSPTATSGPQSFTITVNPVNDEPSFTSGGDVSASSDAGPYSQTNWATNIVVGPPNETQTVTFEVTGNTNGAIFTTAPAIDPSGTLTFTPVAGVSGSSNITVQMRDSGGVANGGDDLSASVTFTITLDSAPAVTTTSPLNGATGVPTNSNVTITFDENVNANPAFFLISCTTSGNRSDLNSNLTGGPLTFTIDPTVDFAPGETCTVSVFASQVTDQDSVDGPDNMAADYVFSFTTDAQPIVTATTPTNAQVGVTTNANVSITFSEPVNVTGTWFQISCATSGMHDPSNSNVSGGPLTFTIDPTDFVQGEVCNATVFAAQVSDVDTNDPLDNPAANYNFTFTIDAEPSVVSTSPANGDFTQQPNTNVTIVFSEAVNVSGNWFSLNCGTTGTRTPANTAVSTTDNITFTLNPNIDFAVGETCASTIVAALVSDQDGNDPPDNLAADYNFTFGFDAPPSVTATTPANSATNLGTDTNIDITFSENVTLTAGWLSITCGVTTITDADGAVTGGPLTYTFNPTASLPESSTCNVTVLAANVADNDTNDPPDNMTANYNFSFTTDAPPSVTATSPTNGATNQASNTNVVITFDEAVNIGGGTWFTLVCSSSGTHDPSNSATTGSGTAVVTINPSSDFTQGETCNATIFAAEVSDADANDPPNLMASNYLFSFSIDAAPSVTAVTPLDLSTQVATNTNLTITFSEPVTITNASVTISCANSGAHAVAVSGGPTVWTVDPTSDFATGELCSISVLAAGVADNDSNDPPDNMLANYNFSFTTDNPPSVTATTPTNGGGSSPNANISVTFSEPVDATGSSFTINCTTSGAHTYVLGGTPTTYTLDPNTDFTGGETCTVTVLAAQVDDQDLGDPPSNMVTDYVFSFTVDAAPTVVTTSPTNGATNNATNINIVITYDEPVTAGGTAYTLKCTPSNTSRPFVLTGNGTAVHTLDPNTILPAGQTCTVDILASQITDVDTIDPPDNMAANYSFSFTTDANPQIVSTSPVDTSTNNATTTNIVITWTEPVTMTTAGISCTVSGSHTSVLSSGDNIAWTINPDIDFTPGETCTISILSASVTDVDLNDPPDNPGPDFSFQFTIDSPPAVTTTVPADTSTTIATNSSITINFNESVVLTATPVTISCASSGAHTYSVSAGPATSFTIDPTADFAMGELCTVTAVATEVADNDTADPPNNLTANYVFSFTTDFAPSVMTTTPADNAITGPSSDVTVTFSEAVTVTDPWFTISCTTSGTHTAVVNTSDSITYTLNPDNDFVAGETCTVTVLAAQVADQDLGDPPDNMLGDHVFDFTIDGPPSVLTTSPANGDTNKATNVNIVITYDEPVTAGGTAYTLSCTPSNTSRPFVLSGNGTAVHTLDPNTNLPAGQTCTVAILAAQIADTDTNDPPDNMAANYNFSFTTDANPQITATSPNDGSTVAANTNIDITWTETVTMTAVGINCTVSGSHTNVLTTSDNITWTVNPDTDFTPAETCTISVLSANVTDNDTNDPPDNPGPDISWQYTVDAQPSVTATTPTNGATNQATNTNIVITFSEAVTAPDAAFTINCGGAQAFTGSGSGTTTVTLDPTADLPAGTSCTVTVIATSIADVDSIDPPDNMAANYVFSFTTDAPPSVTTTNPTNASIDNAKTANIVINFSENVDVTGSSFEIKCPSSGGTRAFGFVGGTTGVNAVTLDPTLDLVSGEVCQVTVFANQVADSDTNDPPNNMVADYVFSFSVEPDAINDTHPHTHVGNIQSNSATFFKVTTNDLSANPFTISAFDATTANGGQIVMQTTGPNMGEFTYNPPPGFEGTDTFTYTINNAHGTDTATVSIPVAGMVWFIDQNDGVGPFDGRLGSPFQTLAQFEASALPGAGDNVFLYESGTAYTGTITLDNNMRLIGQDSTIALFGAGSVTGLTPAASQPAGPGVNSANGVFVNITSGSNGVNLGTNNLVRGMRFGNNTTNAIFGAAVGNLTIADALINNGTGGGLDLSTGTLSGSLASLSTTGGQRGIRLNAVAGSLNIPAGTITNATQAAIDITGQNPTVTFGGTISQTNGRTGLMTSNLTGGTITLNTVNVSGTQANNDAIVLDGAPSGSPVIDLTVTSVTINNGGNNSDGIALGDLSSGSDVTITGGTITTNASNRRLINFTGATNCNCDFSGVTFVGSSSDGLSLGATQLGTYKFGATTMNTPNGGIGVQVIGDANSGNIDSTVEFKSISIATCSNTGINVNSHSGTFKVNGTGAANSGGTISGCTQRGARFGTGAGTANSGAKNVTLTDMLFSGNGTADLAASGTCGDGANGTNTNCAANIDLQDTNTATLTRVRATGSVQIGINAKNVTDLVLDTVEVDNNGSNDLEDGLQIINLTTTAQKTWTNLNVHDNYSRQLEIQNLTGTNNLIINNSQFIGGATFPVGHGAQGILFSGSGASTNMTLVVNNATFTRNFSAAFASDTAGGADITVTVDGGSMNDNGQHFTAGGAGSGDMTYTLQNVGTMSQVPGHTAVTGIAVLKSLTHTGSMTGTFLNNTIGIAGTLGSGAPCGGCNAISVRNEQTTGTHNLLIQGNTIQRSSGGGISIFTGNTNDSSVMNLKIYGNTVTGPDGTGNNAIIVSNGAGLTPNSSSMCADIGGSTAALKNTINNNSVGGSAGSWLAADALRLRDTTESGTVRVPNLATATPAGVVTHLTNNNTLGAGLSASSGSSGTYTGGVAPCF